MPGVNETDMLAEVKKKYAISFLYSEGSNTIHKTKVGSLLRTYGDNLTH